MMLLSMIILAAGLALVGYSSHAGLKRPGASVAARVNFLNLSLFALGTLLILGAAAVSLTMMRPFALHEIMRGIPAVPGAFYSDGQPVDPTERSVP